MQNLPLRNSEIFTIPTKLTPAYQLSVGKAEALAFGGYGEVEVIEDKSFPPSLGIRIEGNLS
jgi:hypothetical protein